jgi:hypothetical protein
MLCIHTLCFEEQSSASPSAKHPRTKKANPVKSWLFLVLARLESYALSKFADYTIIRTGSAPASYDSEAVLRSTIPVSPTTMSAPSTKVVAVELSSTM